MRPGRRLLLTAARSRRLNEFALHSSFVRRATRKFMPGERPEDALDAGALIASTGRGLIFTQLGEAITIGAEADGVRDHYLWFFDQVRARALPAHVSVKPTQLGLDLSYDDCLLRLTALAARARDTGSVLWLDMEDSSYVDRTLDLYSALKPLFPSTGVALQAYLRRTPADLERLMPLRPVVRLVKGAYDEAPEVAFPRKQDTDAAYEQLAETMLLSPRQVGEAPIFATHDLPLIARLAARASTLGVPKGGYEIHMLYGIRDAEQRRLAAEGHTVRTLVSYGAAWFRWYMRRLAERPANVGFLVRSMLG